MSNGNFPLKLSAARARLLIAAGVGEGMASILDINHLLRELAGMIGVLSVPVASLPVAAMQVGRGARYWRHATTGLMNCCRPIGEHT